jgi:hypothetical protein
VCTEVCRQVGRVAEKKKQNRKRRAKESRAGEHVNCGRDPQGLGSQRGRTDDGDRHGDGGPCGGAGFWEGVTWGVMDVQLIFASVRPPRTHRALLVVEKVVAPDGVSECRHMADEGRGQTGRPWLHLHHGSRRGEKVRMGWDEMGWARAAETRFRTGWVGLAWIGGGQGSARAAVCLSRLESQDCGLWTVATRMLLWPGGRPRRASLD